jgi:DNA-binding IclR family transcriptional regulator
MTTKPKRSKADDSRAPYLTRVFQLLRIIADAGETGLRVPEICQKLDIHRVSAHRLLKSLTELGYVEQATNLSYHLGVEAWSLGVAASRRFIRPDLAAALRRVSDATEECVFLMRRTGNVGVCIAMQEGTFPVRSFVIRVGTRRHLGVGGSSVAILSGLPPKEADHVIRQNSPEYRNFGLTADKVRIVVREAREQGFAYSPGIVVPESHTVAVPLQLTANPSTMMSISIVSLESRLVEPRRQELASLLQAEAMRLRSS